MTLKKTYTFDSVTFFVYDKYIVAEVGEGVDIYRTEADDLYKVAKQHFKDEFGLIDHRVHNISINPDVYRHISDTFDSPKMTSFALVSGSSITRQSFAVEQAFIDNVNIKHELFISIDKAKEWMEENYKDKDISL